MSNDPTFDGVSPEVAELLAAARATTPVAPDAALLSSMAVAVGTGNLNSTVTTPRRKTLIGKLITAKVFGIVGALALTGGAAAAATGTLPDPIQDTASNAADVVGISIPDSNHGSEVSPVARDKDGDVEGENHGSRVSETARDNHGHNKDDDTTTTTVEGDNSGPGKSTTRGNAGDHSNSGKHDGTDDSSDDSDDDSDDDDATTTTTIDDDSDDDSNDDGDDDSDRSGSNKGKGSDNKPEDAGSHRSGDDD